MNKDLFDALETAILEVLASLADVEDGLISVESGTDGDVEEIRVTHFPDAEQQSALWHSHQRAVERLIQAVSHFWGETETVSREILRLLDRGHLDAVFDADEQALKKQRLLVLGRRQGLEILAELMKKSLE